MFLSGFHLDLLPPLTGVFGRGDGDFVTVGVKAWAETGLARVKMEAFLAGHKPQSFVNRALCLVNSAICCLLRSFSASSSSLRAVKSSTVALHLSTSCTRAKRASSAESFPFRTRTSAASACATRSSASSLNMHSACNRLSSSCSLSHLPESAA